MKDLFFAATDREEPAVLFAEKEHVAPGGVYGPVVRSITVVECCTGGRGAITINDQTFPVEKGSCYVLLPGDAVTHHSDPADPRQGYWCALDGVRVSALVKKAGVTSHRPFLPRERYAPLCRVLKHLAEEFQCTDGGAVLRQTACGYAILGLLLKGSRPEARDALIEKAVGILQTRYPDPMTVGELADAVGLERSYFSELFRAKIGLSPYRYLTLLRIQKAMQLLAEGHGVTESAYLVGMDPHNFGRVFKKETGLSPREYAKGSRTGARAVLARSVAHQKP